ncbi:MAG: hypothetical protein IJ488_02850 [Clostridia bacterium]|nr:hypothetical protein [Clostridia bacterium]
MFIYILFLGYTLSKTLSDIMRKANSKTFSLSGLTGSLFYIFETSLFALFFFWALNGFTLSFNPRVIMYGFVYGIIVVVSLVPTIFMYNYASFAYITFLSGSLSLVFSLLAGMTVFGEELTVEKVVRILLMLVATLIIFLGRNAEGKKKEGADGDRPEKKRHSPKLYICIFVSVLLGCASTVLLKFYSQDAGVTDQNSMFFATNIFSALLTLPILPFTMKRDGVSLSDIGKMLKSKKTVYSAITTANSNVASIIQITLLSMMEVSVFNPIAGALSFVAMAIAVPIMGERLNRYTVLSTATAILSVVIPALIASVI